MRERPPLLTISSDAARRIQVMLDQRGKPSAGIRVSLKTRGCSGLAYALEYADQARPQDERVEAHGVTVFIDPRAVMFLVGTEMLFEEGKLQSGFVFKNPNEKGRCGCGESFHV